ncbi:4Fe-4S dicluster domain-containing protein [Halomonas sp. SSL-5]|uniref:4Fe-4S dicluster domain-containing protein n=1 Tax=Halomonas sp. SSL-5 TaxID=3065855 RepID=UPI0027398902|nr:4Fe-4S dicluster domain-containing protein [Halomonas sp. SSL-5]MDY7117579.1 4Fe-4S dicluster domain-containing protein [Halomonas sp. SSL-5]
MRSAIDAVSVDDAANRSAREAARQRVSWPVNLTPASVTYESAGHALLLGDETSVRLAAQRLQGRGLAAIALLITEPSTGDAALDDAGVEALLENTRRLPCQTLTPTQRGQLRVEGYLGRFGVSLHGPDERLDLALPLLGRRHADLILDLGRSPALALELPPPGYRHLAWGGPGCDEALDAFAELVGEFDKPRYFQINADLCAHSASGNVGCTRCLEVCPADAISSHKGRIESRIEIDPYLCQGVGSCTSACPTGAIQFRLPEPARQQEALVSWLDAYRQAGGKAAVMRFVEAGDLEAEDEPAGGVLDVPLEELGNAGHDQWLTALAAGAAEVRIQVHPELPASLAAFIDDQVAQARTLLEALGHAPDRIRCIQRGDGAARDAYPVHLPLVDEPLVLSAERKRDRFEEVLARLTALGKADGRRHPMPPGAAYGGLEVDRDACTLCFACVSNCPTPALATGDDSPLLSYREADCVQCGLCAEACPEDAIRLAPGFLADASRTERQVRHEEAPFCCTRCGKPFANAATIATIKAKLADHPYFAGDAAARLEMCEDCRVKDVYQGMVRDPDSQLKV